METAEHLDALRADGPRLVEAALAAGLDAPVPTCPEWRVGDLLRHVGGVHRWAAGYVGTGLDRPTTDAEAAALFAAPDDAGLAAWCLDGHARLIERFARPQAAETTVFSFLPAPTHYAFWARRQAHETAIHRTDAEAAAGRPAEVEPGFAADGIAELLNGFFARKRGRLVAPQPTSLAVRTTDADPRAVAQWTIVIGTEGRTVVPEVREADCTLVGAAADLYLALWNRADATRMARIDVLGDAGVLDLWRSRALVTWS